MIPILLAALLLTGFVVIVEAPPAAACTDLDCLIPEGCDLGSVLGGRPAAIDSCIP